MESGWNDNYREKPKDSENNLSQRHFAHENPTWTDLVAYPDFRSEKPATKGLICGTVLAWSAE